LESRKTYPPIKDVQSTTLKSKKREKGASAEVLFSTISMSWQSKLHIRAQKSVPIMLFSEGAPAVSTECHFMLQEMSGHVDRAAV
jgi:hypothetical protein